jgi:hypothetical protein
MARQIEIVGENLSQIEIDFFERAQLNRTVFPLTSDDGKDTYTQTHTHSDLALPQEASRWLPTAAAQVQSHIKSCQVCSVESSAGAGFLRVLLFPIPIFIHRLLYIHLSSRAGTVDQLVTDVPSRLNLTPLPHETNYIYCDMTPERWNCAVREAL